MNDSVPGMIQSRMKTYHGGINSSSLETLMGERNLVCRSVRKADVPEILRVCVEGTEGIALG